MTVAIVYTASGRRSAEIADAMAAGCKRLGVKVIRRTEAQYREPEGDVAVFYGLEGKLLRALTDYPASGRTAVHLDLGIWQRHYGGRYTGFHRVAVNGRWSTPHLPRRQRTLTRLEGLGVRIAPWRPAEGNILLAGMGAKAAMYVGYQAEEWERWAISEIRHRTDRPIVYRPKPSWLGAKPIEGCVYNGPNKPLEFTGTFAVVTHHSNVAIEGLAAGVPAFCWQGPAAVMGLQDLSRIETPWRSEERERWLANMAWWQWSVGEMKQGDCWRWLIDEGLVPR